MTRLIICCCSCENDVLTVFTVTDLNLLSPVSRKVPGHLSKKKGDLPSESIESPLFFLFFPDELQTMATE